MKKYFLKFLLCMSIFLGRNCFCEDAHKNNFFQLLDKNNQDAMIGFGDKFEKYFTEFFPGFKIFSYCVGSFQKSNSEDTVLGIVNPITNESFYVALLENLNGSPTQVKLATFHPNASLLQGPSVECKSSTSLNRLNNAIQKSEGTRGQLKPINFLDSVCLNDAVGFSYEHTCLSFDKKNKKFIVVGGWST